MPSLKSNGSQPLANHTRMSKRRLSFRRNKGRKYQLLWIIGYYLCAFQSPFSPFSVPFQSPFSRSPWTDRLPISLSSGRSIFDIQLSESSCANTVHMEILGRECEVEVLNQDSWSPMQIANADRQCWSPVLKAVSVGSQPFEHLNRTQALSLHSERNRRILSSVHWEIIKFSWPKRIHLAAQCLLTSVAFLIALQTGRRHCTSPVNRKWWNA